MASLFDDDERSGPATTDAPAARTPLAERMRPRALDEIVGQAHLLAPGRPLREAIDADVLQSIILWGPPGTGKTTLARVIAETTRAKFVGYSAVMSGIKEIKAVMAEAEETRRRLGRRTMLFVDEIHRFNKAQQDAFLPRVEAGDLVLVGATTENPSFEVNAALLSRSKVFVLQPLDEVAIVEILRRAWRDEARGLGLETPPHAVSLADDGAAAVARYASGDARVALNALELVGGYASRRGLEVVDAAIVAELLEKRALLYDKTGEEHYNLISALHKSLRNSDPDAAIYWLARMLEAGEDPMFVARRLVRFASEDVGLADPQALSLCVAAAHATHQLGMPEANTALAQATVYLATAPKSNAIYAAYGAASADATGDVAEPVPTHLRNAPTRLMKQLGYGQGYEYAHDAADAITGMDCLPARIQGRQYYRPSGRGYEKTLADRLSRWAELKRARKGAAAPSPGQGDDETLDGPDASKEP